MSITFCTLNTKGLRNKQKRLQVFKYLENKKYDVIFLQETHSDSLTNKTWQQEWEGDSFFSGVNSNKEGVAFLVNKISGIKCSNFNEIVSGRLTTIEININNKDINLVNVYGPNNDNPSLFNKLENFISNNNESNIIVGGDFNTIINPSMDKKNGRMDTNKKCQSVINSIMSNYELNDIWRENNPNEKQFTWHSNTKPVIFSRLDYFLISEYLRNTLPKCTIKPGFKTDHSAVILNINTVEQAKGPGYFKINNNIIKDQEYKIQIQNAISEILETNNNCNPNTIWELIKGSIRNTSIKYSTNIKKKQDQKEKELTSKLKKLQENEQIDNNDNIIEEMNTLKQELDLINTQKINGMILRAKAQHIEYNEKNSKYFANLEKRHYERKTITKLKTKHSILTDTKDILNEQRNFFKNLYRKQINHDPNESNSDFFEVPINKLNNEDKIKCEGLITIQECTEALNEMNLNKSPGSDGLTVEFYKEFWEILKEHYVNSINYSFRIQSLTDLQIQGLVSLIPKPKEKT